MELTHVWMAVLLLAGTASASGQVPQAKPALDAARDARTKTEAAQQKNADALRSPGAPGAGGAQGAPGAPSAQGAPGAQPPASSTPPQGTAAPAKPQGAETGAGYTYDPAGRRDPFVSLTARGGELPVAGARPNGVPGLLIGEVTVKGIFKSPKGGFLALLQAPDGRTYIVKQGDKLFDGSIKALTSDAVVFSQDVNDPLSLVKQREVRKSIRPEAR